MLNGVQRRENGKTEILLYEMYHKSIGYKLKNINA